MAGFSIQGLLSSNWKPGCAGIEMCGQMEREAEGDERGDERDPCRKLAAVGQQGDEDRAGERDEKDQRENRVVH